MTEHAPLHVFRFEVSFHEHGLRDVSHGGEVALCSGAFSQCSGLEATMEPKAIREGGRNYGEVQRVGMTKFGTVIFRRGITDVKHLWRWFELVNARGKYAYRLTAKVKVLGPPIAQGDSGSQVRWTWQLTHCLPTKLKAPDLDAKGNEVGIEELHVVHEGLVLDPPAEQDATDSDRAQA